MRLSIVLAFFATLVGCTTTGGGSQAFGAASCAASAAGACPEVNNRSIYNRRNADLTYFAPDGTAYELRGTAVRRTRWSVSPDGKRLLGSGSSGFDRAGVPIDLLVSVSESYRGDPAGLSSGNVATRLKAYDTRPFPRIAAELRGR